MNRARDTTTESVPTQLNPANTNTFAANVTKTTTSDPAVQTERWGRRPCYARALMWVSVEKPTDNVSLADTSLYMTPLPRPPANKVLNEITLNTIQNNPWLFSITMPINVDCFEALLNSHPNQAFVQSMCTGFRQGFWLQANIDNPDIPLILDHSRKLNDPEHLAFACEQQDKEIAERHFSPTFPALLPGMQCVPVVVVPKPHTNKFRLAVDHSAEPDVKIKMNDLHDLGAILLHVCRVYRRSTRLVVFKSDVPAAYRRLPMDPRWQMKQVVGFGNGYNVDQCNNFGSRDGGGLYGSFMVLMLWTTIYVKLITDLLAWVDDTFGWDFEENLAYYAPYAEFYSLRQTRLLEYWDEIRLPHKKPKQLWGIELLILGFVVDPNAMTITMSCKARSDLVQAIQNFAGVGNCWTLKEYQHLGGWINWSLNVYPLLCPGLSALYEKMAGKNKSNQRIWMNKAVVRELLWIVKKIEVLEVVYCDTCPMGMGFWVCRGGKMLGYQCVISGDATEPIFYFEALTVVSAILYAIKIPSIHHVFVFTDNANTVDMFHSLKARQLYNPLLLTVTNHTICSGVQFRVSHIPGEENGIADALSQFDYDRISQQPVREVWSWEHLLHERNIALGSVLKPSSLSSYTSAVQSYVTFCCSHDFLIDPTTDTLSFYIVYICHFIKPKSVSSYLSGICNQLKVFYPDIHQNCTHPIIKQMLKGCKKIHNSVASRKRPLQRTELTEVFDKVHSSTSFDDQIFLILLFVGFFALMRLGVPRQN
ncbi:hypothetical protein BT96DRAFT_1026532 [Gymnopus androsaceus JB14]|uniref:DNA/RNA polymerase n=1 Tax=Gymnopus androsaceus JB14 TaxID=1447944 RepID=A0A6A4GJP7_9AGAR|nr:hypothetical protein BT96DRAFT_1026532 [Gymnopus androsaceus JB14]